MPKPRTASPSKTHSKGTEWGHHVYDEFNRCPRRFLFASVLKYESKNGSINMEIGSAWGAWIEEYHRSGNHAKALRCAVEHITQAGKRFENLATTESIDIIREQVRHFAAYYPAWITEWQAVHGAIDFIEQEQASECIVTHGDLTAPYTTRRDAMTLWKKEPWVWECKVSGLHFDRLLKMHRLGGQISGYVYDAKYHKRKCAGGLLFHARSGVKDPTKLFNMKPMIRTPDVLTNWARSITHTWADIERARIQAEEGKCTDAAIDEAYPQRFNECVGYVIECPFQDACATATFTEAKKVLDTFFQKREE